MKNRYKLILLGILIACTLLALVVAGSLCRKTPVGQTGGEILQSKQPQSTTEAPTNPTVTEETVIVEPVVTAPAQTQVVVTVPTEPEPIVTEPAATQPTQPPATKPTEPDDTLRFPCEIPETGLVIKRIEAYDGLFFEDGSDREVTNITAMVLTNTAQTPMEYVSITLERGGTKLCFSAATVDAGATVIVLEADGQPFAAGDYTACAVEYATVNKLELSEALVRVTETDDGSLLVENLTDRDIPCVRIFYKFYMHDTQVYVGGITYNARVEDLKAGSAQTVTPSHYLSGYSRIVMVKTYEE